MKEMTKIMINDFKIMKLGYDFMGYSVKRKEGLSFHHLIIPHRDCKNLGLGEGYLYWNGAILNQNTSHDYLHMIESKDYDLFLSITSEIIDMNVKGYLDIENLKRISELLKMFEREHCGDRSKKGKLLIKEEYTRRMIK
ncbi:MAG: hypothetical protein V8Q75_03475 [Bacilli bacterium]